MCDKDKVKTGVYACVEQEVMADLPMVALRFVMNEKGELLPTHLVLDNLSYEVSHTTLREGMNSVCAAAQEAIETARESIITMQTAHQKAAALLQDVYPDYDPALDWTDNFKQYLEKVKQ